MINCECCGNKGLPSVWDIVRNGKSLYRYLCTLCANNATGERDIKTLTIKQ